MRECIQRFPSGLGLLMVLLLGLLATDQAEAQDEAPRIDTAAVRSGFQLYREGRWSEIRSIVTNPTGQIHRPLVSTRLGSSDHIEFSRRLWMPPYSQRFVYTPILPFKTDPDSFSIEAPTRLIDDRGRTPRAWPWQSSLLPIRGERLSSVHVGEIDHDDSRRVVRALRMAAGRNDVVLLTMDHNLPARSVAWDVVDTLTLSHSKPGLSIAQREALRQWLMGGGRLWIMLEQVDENWLSKALGESWDISISDRVGLHDFAIEGPSGSHGVSSRAGVEMVRVFAPADMEVIHTVDGYPASMRRSVGRGEVLITTIGPEAWIDLEVQGEESARTVLRELRSFVQSPPLSGEQRRERILEAFEPMVREQIGYSILGREWVLMVLGLFVAALLGAGAFLAWCDRLEMMGVSSLVISLVAAGGLIGLGMSHHRSVDLTVATGQFIYTDNEQPYIKNIGSTGIYRPDGQGGDRMTVKGKHGVLWPVGIDTLGSWTRLEWTDDDRWQMSRSLPPGTVHGFSGGGTQPVESPTGAVLRFTGEGMQGELKGGSFGQWSDGFIGSQWAHMAVAFDGDSGGFRVNSRRLERHQYIAGATLTDQQHRRQEVYRSLADGGIFPDRPMMLAWADNGPRDLSLDVDSARQTHSLVLVPIEIEPPEPGLEVNVPPALMRKVPATSGIDSEYRPGALYDVDAFKVPGRDQWNELIGFDATAVMRFELPEALHHLEVRNATVRFNLRAPGWRYEVLVWRDGEIQAVAEGVDPLGEMEVRLRADQAPQMLADGAVLAGLRIERSEGGGGDQWTLRRLSLELNGVAGPQP